MKNRNVMYTDILVVGGGIAGLTCAIKAAESNARVLVAEKAVTGGAGMATRAGNGLLAILEEEIEDYVEYHVRRIGQYANDQDQIRQLAEVNLDTLNALKGWGVKITTDEKGNLGFFKNAGSSPWHMCGIELGAMLAMLETAKKAKVEIKDHFQVTGLVKDGARIAGAVGFDIYNGAWSVINAKAVVLCTGACGYRNIRMFINHGEGNSLAYDAGAQMRSAEFGNFYEVYSVDKGDTLHGTYPFVYNSKGENLWDKYNGDWDAPAPTPEMNAGMVKEYLDGNGPLYVDFEKLQEAIDGGSEWGMMGQTTDVEAASIGTGLTRMFPDKLRWVKLFDDREAEFLNMTKKPEVKLGLHGNTGCVRVGLDFQTTVPGLFASGIDSFNGSGYAGAAPQPGMQKGNGIGYAASSAFVCGTAVATYVNNSKAAPVINEAQVEILRKETFLPIERATGIDPHDVIEAVQECVAPIRFNCIRSGDRLNEALGMLEKVKNEMIPKMYAKDWHGLKVCHEAKAMAVTAELMMRSALVRTESRGFHIREDYPERDDVNWLKWVLVDNADGRMVVSTEPIPMEKYKYKPE